MTCGMLFPSCMITLLVFAIPHFAAMAPKLSVAEKCQRTRRATLVLRGSSEVQELEKESARLKAELHQAAKEKRKKNRQLRKLKAKASKCNVLELMQIMMLKAYLMNEAKRQEGSGRGGAASSSEEWRPKSFRDAFAKIEALMGEEMQQYAALSLSDEPLPDDEQDAEPDA